MIESTLSEITQISLNPAIQEAESNFEDIPKKRSGLKKKALM